MATKEALRIKALPTDPLTRAIICWLRGGATRPSSDSHNRIERMGDNIISLSDVTPDSPIPQEETIEQPPKK